MAKIMKRDEWLRNQHDYEYGNYVRAAKQKQQEQEKIEESVRKWKSFKETHPILHRFLYWTVPFYDVHIGGGDLDGVPQLLVWIALAFSVYDTVCWPPTDFSKYYLGIYVAVAVLYESARYVMRIRRASAHKNVE